MRARSRWRLGARRPWRAVVPALAVAGALACASADEAADDERARHPLLSADAAGHVTSLAVTGSTAYRVDTATTAEWRVAGGWLSGTVQIDGRFPADTLVAPTHDTHACRPYPDAPLRGSPDGVGDAVVWLVGVTSGPPDTAPRRHTIALQGCRIEPRLTRVPQGATLIVRSGDAMDSRLRFLDASLDGGPTTRSRARAGDSSAMAAAQPPSAPRALVPLGDAGALVPITAATDRAGLVEIRDDRHPWVRGWLAVAPHPFVAVTDAAGRFSFERVPPGRYVLVAWHERLGTVASAVVIEPRVEARVRLVLTNAR